MRSAARAGTDPREDKEHFCCGQLLTLACSSLIVLTKMCFPAESVRHVDGMLQLRLAWSHTLHSLEAAQGLCRNSSTVLTGFETCCVTKQHQIDNLHSCCSL